MDAHVAQRIIESLRQGIPPSGFVCDFTVGRHSEILTLSKQLAGKKSGAVLLKANYGSGKTHLLRFIREIALSMEFAVSTITLDAKSAVRFNRMDQILGAIFRGLEVANGENGKGLRPFFDLIADLIEMDEFSKEASVWKDLTNNGRWDYSDLLGSPALFVAIRSWYFGDAYAKDLVENWLYNPWNYKSQRKTLYKGLVESLRDNFRDPRQDWQFYADDVFSLDIQGYSQCWAILRDLQSLAVAAGLKGLIVLCDEFEDVLNNINNIAHQQSAFWNLFQFYGGKRFDGMSFFAVTPEFVYKCQDRLHSKGVWDYDFSQFETIPTFQMSPLGSDDLEKLAIKIMETHGIAYDWEPDMIMKHSELKSIVSQTASIAVEDRGRNTIRRIVKSLDALYHEQI